ncbi:MAG TPA: PAS domain-containing protein [Phycisphaerae bacterium]|nr:PAS domain-containing protein [Phycisphaerae bacterium]HOJ73322.1 PAS domain-containing protein [Phycisphaerae bacterium]HOM51112.1 PAS domain-containing protein [Phycisphaerae bacterium]HON66091.1 PAS domain-containing protein [Phycisphaerae bacterium]HOQ86076.1 PAS domain-containing protein [Phycisphaerae bacterium]
MISSLSSKPLNDPTPLLSEDRLRSLARTYQRVESPIWIHNLQGDCIYVNPPAERITAPVSPVLFDILDHNGRVIGRLGTIPN